MQEQLSVLVEKAKSNNLFFQETLEFINLFYIHTPGAFRNGEMFNGPDENQGSARVFAFAKKNHLDQATTLALFAEHYQSVLADPDGSNHQNIRQFMINGLEGIAFDDEVLVKR